MIKKMSEHKQVMSRYIMMYCFTLFCSVRVVVADQGNFKTLQGWVDHCFTALPENPVKGMHSPSGVTLAEIDELFGTFRGLLGAQLSDTSRWVGGVQVPSTLLTSIEKGNLGKDVQSPYVRKIEVPAGSILCVMGDLHGSVHALLRNLLRLYAQGFISNDWKLISHDGAQRYFIFTGDFVDYGAYGSECWCTLMKLYNENPNNVVLVRGNHEEFGLWNGPLLAEIIRKFGSDNLVAERFNDFCKKLPHAAFLQSGIIALNKPAVVQCSHGGIEPAFNPTTLLKSTDGQTFAAVTGSCTGLNWSDFTGVENKKPVNKKQGSGKRQKKPGDGCVASNQWTWFLDYWWNHNRIHGAGYLADIPDTKTYCTKFGLAGFFRGHQDTEHSLKLVKNGVHGVVKWDQVLLGLSESDLQLTGVKMSHFIDKLDTVPVFTFSTAVEGRGLPDEGFGLITTALTFSNWLIKPHIYPVLRLNQPAYVRYAINFGSESVGFSLHTAIFLGVQKSLENLASTLTGLQVQLQALRQKLDDLKSAVEAIA